MIIRIESVINHVLSGGAELLVSLDDLVDGFDQILLGDGFAAISNCEHAGLSAN